MARTTTSTRKAVAKSAPVSAPPAQPEMTKELAAIMTLRDMGVKLSREQSAMLNRYENPKHETQDINGLTLELDGDLSDSGKTYAYKVPQEWSDVFGGTIWVKPDTHKASGMNGHIKITITVA